MEVILRFKLKVVLDWLVVEWCVRHHIPPGPTSRCAAAPQMVEVSRDGKRVYFTNSL
jgi:hypothetical protein